MLEKDAEWRGQHELLQNEFGSAMRHTLEQNNIENMTRTQLEQVHNGYPIIPHYFEQDGKPN